MVEAAGVEPASENTPAGDREEPALLDYATRAPHVGEAVPSSEHFDPLFFVLGASRTDDRLETVHAGFQYANLSMRCVAFESS